MGTSTARRAPTTRAWRLTKVTATRYLSPDPPTPVEAREVVARYVAALAEGSGQETGVPLAAFGLTRKTAQNLGEFCQQNQFQDSPNNFGLNDRNSPAPLAAAHILAATWLAGDNGLEAAALRPALVKALAEVLQSFPEPSQAVKNFLAAALHQRLVFDLGEPLEAAASGWRHLADGLAGIEKEIVNAAEAEGSAAPPPATWQGLEGWLWITRLLEEMLGHFTSKTMTKK